MVPNIMKNYSVWHVIFEKTWIVLQIWNGSQLWSIFHIRKHALFSWNFHMMVSKYISSLLNMDAYMADVLPKVYNPF